MIQQVKVPVSVVSKFDHRLRKSFPVKITWEGRDYPILKIGLHHTYRDGRTLHHVFSVAGTGLYFKLVLNTENLRWTLLEVADGLTS
jgi:hypothetical protein